MPTLTLSMDEPDIFNFEEATALSSKTPIPFGTSEETELGTALSESAKAKQREQITKNCAHIKDQRKEADAAQIALLFLHNSGSGSTSPAGSGQNTPEALSPRTSDEISPPRRPRSLSEESYFVKKKKQEVAGILSDSSDNISRLTSQATVQITCPDGTLLPNETRRFDTPNPSPSSSQKRLQQSSASGAIQTDVKKTDRAITPPDTLSKVVSNAQSPARQSSGSTTAKKTAQPQPKITSMEQPHSLETALSSDKAQNEPSLWIELTKAGISITAFVAFLYYMKWLPDNAIQTFDTYLSKLSNLVFLDTSVTDQ